MRVKKSFLTAIIIVIVIFLLGMAYLYYYIYMSVPQFAASLIPDMPNITKNDKVVIFAPHSDDETLGTGELISKSIKNGAQVWVIFATNGDGSRFTTAEEFNRVYPTKQNYIDAGYLRQNESQNALTDLGLDSKNIIFLGYPDGGLKKLLNENWSKVYTSPNTGHTSSPYNNSYDKNVSYTGENLSKDLISILNNIQPDYVFMPDPFDIHPDHAVLGKFVQKVIASVDFSKPKIFSYLIHFRHFPDPKGKHPEGYLTPPVKLTLQNPKWFKLPLDQSEIDQKQKAISEYKSQLQSPFLKKIMESFVRKNELFNQVY